MEKERKVGMEGRELPASRMIEKLATWIWKAWKTGKTCHHEQSYSYVSHDGWIVNDVASCHVMSCIMYVSCPLGEEGEEYEDGEEEYEEGEEEQQG